MTTIDGTVANALQLGLGGVFLVAAYTKISAPRAWARTVAAYQILPASVVGVAAVSVVTVEFLLAFALLTGFLVVVALAVAAVCLMTFAVAVAVNLRRGRAVPCGCFGPSGDPISMGTLARLGLLLGATVLVAGLIAGGAASPFVPGAAAPVELVSTAGTGLFLVLAGAWAVHLPHLRDLTRP